MRSYIKERATQVGHRVIETKMTIRDIAGEFGVSKSTIHKDLVQRLPEIDKEMASKVRRILNYHLSIRHLRGGEATKIKYKR